MNRFIKHKLLPACAVAALMALSACGGGDDTSQQPSAQTISFTAPGNQTFGTVPAALVATATSGLPVTLASTTASVCMVSGTTLTLVGVGTCTVGASQAGNASFVAAPPVSNSFTVAVGAQTISFISPGNQTLGAPTAALVATASSGLPVTLDSTTTGICTASGTTLTLLAVGSCTISASQTGNATFSAAAAVSNTFTIAAAPLPAQTITFASPGNQTLGTAPPALVATSSSGLTVTLTSTTTPVCTALGSTLTLVSAGDCTIAASQAGSNSFAAATNVSRTFAVAPAPQTISFISPGNQTLGTPTAALVATASSGLPVTLVSTTTGICTASGTTLTLLAVGSCTISAGQPGNANVGPAAPVSNTFTIAAAPLTAQTITFASPGNQTLGTAPPALIATSSSGLTVTLTSTTTPVCTVLGSTLTLVTAGGCTIVASQAGNSSFAAATNVSHTVTVAAAPAGPELIADGGFETAPAVAGQFALGWRGTNGPTAGNRTNADAHTGTWSAVLRVVDPGFGGSGLAGNSVDDGGLVPVSSAHWGKASILTFWAKGNASVTGNVNYSLRYLDSIGNILNPVVNTQFQGLINETTWTKITKTGVVIPTGTTAVFLEMTLATGPTGVTTNPDNTVSDYGQARVLIDDVSVTVVP